MTSSKTFSASAVLSEQERKDGLSRFNPMPDIATPCFRLLWLDPGSCTPRHNHTETELWTVLGGRVEVDVEGVRVTLDVGSLITLPPLQRHDIRPADAPAVLQVCFWHDQAHFEEAVKQFGTTTEASNVVHFVIPNWITPNGPLHLGHASGPYISADVLRRALVLTGAETVYAAGTLGHLEHIAVAASERGMNYYELADLNTKSISESFRRLQIVPDVFLDPRPTQRFKEIVHELFEELHAAEAIEERETAVPFDARIERYVVDAHLLGSCPHCGARAFGHECEGCGGSMLDSELQSPTNRSGETLTHRPLRRMFLKLAKLRPYLQHFRDTAILPSQASCFIDAWLAKELPALCITNPLSEGIPVSLPGYESQRFTVFMEHAARHFFAIEQWAHRKGIIASWRELARRNDIQLSLFFGSDNSFGRLIITPTVTAAVGAKSLVAKRCYLNHFLLLDGSKFSTGRNHAIWVNDFVEETNSDFVRFFLTLVRPEVEETDFTLTQFKAHVNEFWKGQFVKLLGAVRAQMELVQGSELPPAGTWERDDIRFYKRIMEMDACITHWYRPDTFDPSLVARRVQEFVRDTLAFARSCEPWPRQGLPSYDRARTQARLIVCALTRVSLALYPIAPKIGEMLIKLVGAGRPSMAWLERSWLTEPMRPFAVSKVKAIEEHLHLSG
jgi:methionyl-tRNA synthetase